MTSSDQRADPSIDEAADIAAQLDVDSLVGLTGAEAAARLARDGPNELRAKPPVPVWRKILAQFQDPLVYLLLVAIAISLVAWLAEGAHGCPVDAIVIAVDRGRQRRPRLRPGAQRRERRRRAGRR